MLKSWTWYYYVSENRLDNSSLFPESILLLISMRNSLFPDRFIKSLNILKLLITQYELLQLGDQTQTSPLEPSSDNSMKLS
jgi:hypothetical protein